MSDIYSGIKRAFYLNVIVIEKAYYRDNYEGTPCKVACLKLGSVDYDSSLTDRTLSKRFNEHLTNFGATKSLPILVCERYHPKELECDIKLLLKDMNLDIICLPKGNISKEFYPISSKIIKIIESHIKENDWEISYKNNEIITAINNCEQSNYSDEIFDLIDDDDELIILDSPNDSLKPIQIQKYKENSHFEYTKYSDSNDSNDDSSDDSFDNSSDDSTDDSSDDSNTQESLDG
ncbi:hypothetical protein QKU48_gp1425 [Fadolivirus algeromassiliense]|jgi:hypothetical protein|uniref:Uncharacterized protein n=1 Tax=Fadolivirus FV1/VV64 TaxID=3070911 RepID=A0A7D3QVF7_9VIRU|nr:hypothetical protein QKU48_gp1425 [Fadolivirus algeromassiliense]QKF94883.1 hypothetical protein Fadolivirus_1_1425 [Fadolivirus FV1/VV64]